MHDPTTEERSPAGRRRRADAGATFVEVLVSIVLLGTIVVATLTGLRATIIGSEIDENSARAQAWLQAAADEIFHTTHVDCTVPTIVSDYQAAADAATRPNEWDLASGAAIAVTSVRFLSRAGAVEQWASTCTPSSPLDSQLVTIVVTDPDGDFTKSLEVIKGG